MSEAERPPIEELIERYGRGHTDLLLNDGRVREVEDGGVLRFEAVA